MVRIFKRKIFYETKGAFLVTLISNFQQCIANFKVGLGVGDSFVHSYLLKNPKMPKNFTGFQM